ncbi:MAG: hypothetical protein JNK77_20730 [Saprospiraceae bacterium]|nr:hypothetical protein [Saprospiraceae bacterium]
MRDKEFDDSLKRKLEEFPHREPSFQQWYALHQRIDSATRQKQYGHNRLLYALLLLLLLSNGLQWLLWRNTASGEIKEAGGITHITDTIRHITYRYDTIYSTTYHSDTLYSAVVLASVSANEKLRADTVENVTIPTGRGETKTTESQIAEVPILFQESIVAKEFDKSLNSATVHQSEDSSIAPAPPSLPAKPQRKRPFSAPQLELIYASGFAPFDAEIEKCRINKTGVSASMQVLPRLRVWTNLLYSFPSLIYSSNWTPEGVTPPDFGSEYTLSHWRSTPHNVELALGICYNLPSRNNRWQPSVATGLVGAYLPSYKLIAVFSEEEEEEEETKEWRTRIDRNTSRISAWQNSLAIDYRVSNRLSLRAAAVHQLKLNGNPQQWKQEYYLQCSGVFHL